jgi:hypothetical protein
MSPLTIKMSPLTIKMSQIGLTHRPQSPVRQWFPGSANSLKNDLKNDLKNRARARDPRLTPTRRGWWGSRSPLLGLLKAPC